MSRRRAMLSAVVVLAASIETAAALQAAQSTVYKPGDGVSLPEVVHEVRPDYTREAMQAQIQGSVWLTCVVNENGDVSDIQISRSLDKEYGLDQAAIDAAGQWKFKPGRKDGKAVAVRITIELTFTLK